MFNKVVTSYRKHYLIPIKLFIYIIFIRFFSVVPELPEFLPTDMPLFMDNPLAPLTPDFDMLERLTPAKKEVKPPEPAPRELSYTITTNR